MTYKGIAVLGGSLLLAGLLLFAWVLGLVFGAGGGLIHLLLLLALFIGTVGALAGVVLILVGARHGRRP